MRVNIPIHAEVICRDGKGGTSVKLIVDPVHRRLTHIVVREHGLAESERIVPIDLVEQASKDVIWLHCTREELHGLEDFIDAQLVGLTYATPPVPGPSYESQPYPLSFSERIPEGETALGRLAVVEATDGSIGRVESLVVDMDDAQITYVVALTHHFPTRREVAVPVDEVERFASDFVLLRIDRRDVEGLPHVPFHKSSFLAASDQDLVPEEPEDAGVDDPGADASRMEGAYLLAEEVGPRLRARGFTDKQVLDWAKAFLRVEHSGGDAELLGWIRKQEQASTSH